MPMTCDNHLVGIHRRRVCAFGLVLVVPVGLLAGCGHSSARPAHATFYLRPVYCVIPPYAQSSTAKVGPSNSGALLCSSLDGAAVKTTPVAGDVATESVVLPYYNDVARYVLGPADLDAKAVARATVLSPSGDLGYQVQITFTPDGARAFNRIILVRYPFYQSDPSNPPYQSMEAIEVDGLVWDVPTIQASGFNGVAVITGASKAPFTKRQADTLANQIDASH